MPSTPKPPPAPDPAVVAGLQDASNTKALQQAQAATNINQYTPTGQLQYVQTGTDAQGNPTWTAVSQLSPEQQALYNTKVGTQGIAGQEANSILGGASSMYSGAPDILGGASSQAGQQMAAYNALNQPFNQMTKDHLDTQLRNQGIMPGTPAYDEQMNKLVTQQGLTNAQASANYLPQAFQMALQNYALPAGMAQQLMALGNNDGVNPLTTPSYTPKTTDVAGIYDNNYKNQLSAYQASLSNNNAMMGGIFGIGSALLKNPAIFA